jgi:hypothetical protein
VKFIFFVSFIVDRDGQWWRKQKTLRVCCRSSAERNFWINPIKVGNDHIDNLERRAPAWGRPDRLRFRV